MFKVATLFLGNEKLYCIIRYSRVSRCFLGSRARGAGYKYKQDSLFIYYRRGFITQLCVPKLA